MMNGQRRAATRSRLSVRSLLALWVGRVVGFLLRLMRRRGTSLPGLIALRMSSSLMSELLNQLDDCVLVTGTNGKTTTTAILHGILAASGDAWVTNRGGANLAQGLLAALLPHVTVNGRLRARKAVLEVDEATFPKAVLGFRPDLVVVTNILRDQLDRYGEVDQALQMLRAGLASAPGIALVANADDPLTASLGRDRELTHFFGMARCVLSDDVTRNEVRDGAFCLVCGTELIYEGFIYGQMGFYSCPACKFQRPEPNFSGVVNDHHGALTIVEQNRTTGVSESYEVHAPVLGLYNWYNVLAACSAARVLGLSPRTVQDGVKEYRAPLGRMQIFPGFPRRILALVKNPTGANSVLRAIEADRQDKAICFAINDADADGRDVSWLWDVDLENFIPRAGCVGWYCAGTRGLDMALRLAYAGVPRENIRVVEALSEVPAVIGQADGTIYVLSTYTALHPLADILQNASVAVSVT